MKGTAFNPAGHTGARQCTYTALILRYEQGELQPSRPVGIYKAFKYYTYGANIQTRFFQAHRISLHGNTNQCAQIAYG